MKKITLDCSYLNDVNFTTKNFNRSARSFTDIWILNTQPDTKNLDLCIPLLNQKEKEKAERLYHQADKKNYIISKGFLKLILSKYIKKQPSEIVIESNENGKPFIYDDSNFITHFNLSHSYNSIIIAISSAAVGVDVEKINIAFNYNDVVERCFSDDEKSWLKKSDKPLQDFYLLWTRKEAIVKATSQGIDEKIGFINCLPGNNKINTKYIDTNNSWRIFSHCYNEYMVSIALAKKAAVHFHNTIPA